MTENIRKFLMISLLARKHSRLTGNKRLIVTHNFWVLIFTTRVQYGNRSRKLHPRSPRVQHNMDSCVRGTVIVQKRIG